jgi:PAS domain S-box-containing protein
METQGVLKILVIEDNPGDMQRVRDLLERGDRDRFKILRAEKLSEALQHLSKTPVDVVLLDLGLPDSRGIETLSKIRAEAPAVPILVLHGVDDEMLALNAIRQGAQDFLIKKGLGESLARVIRHAVERHRAGEALRVSQEQSRLVIETASDAFVGMDATGLIMDWNRQAEIIFGWKRSEVIGRALTDTLFPETEREAHLAGLERFLETGEWPILHHRVEISVLHRDGRFFPCEMTLWPIHVQDTYIFNAFLRDISERKQNEEILRARTEELERLNRLMIGREHKMIELKEEIRMLKERLGERVS